MSGSGKFVSLSSAMKSDLPVLYSFRRCPYAMRARLALLASGIAYEHREVVLRDKPAEMLAASPKGTVPVLVLPSGEVIDQSLDIVLWALQQNDPFSWLKPELAAPDTDLEDALSLIAQCDGEFKYHLDRYKYPNRFDGIDDAGKTDHRAKAAAFADHVNALLKQNNYKNYYNFNSCLGIYYVGCMPFLRQFSNTDKTWFATQPWPQLQLALLDFEASTAFKTIMQQHPPWQRRVDADVDVDSL
jgi:glutathione S-transferase